jgi:outer membrane lipoprotein-sorting protein
MFQRIPSSRLFRICAVIACLFGTGVLCPADQLSPVKSEELRKRFESFQKATRFWSARFSQSLSVPGLKQPILSEGRIRFRAPDGLRIDFENPAGEWMLATGERLFWQKPGKKRVEKSLVNDPAGKPIQGLISLLRGVPGSEAEWFTPEISRDGDLFRIELVRKEGAPSHFPKSIVNTLKADSLEVKQVNIQLPNGAQIIYVFEAVERNRPIDPTFFDGDIPH